MGLRLCPVKAVVWVQHVKEAVVGLGVAVQVLVNVAVRLGRAHGMLDVGQAISHGRQIS